ncbi:MAG: hypothetical protein J4203_03830 [Candidatus Diapherotrites archaeon]|uniref:Uncharacterized protein n=1 Tax=Candidatus Iainarchaeum sp. TaxID=3101447 RepID=A0A8T4L8G1_9ARCH|nr:hypothetical protein [Candidatus Diapherotrites archaeon]
MPESELKEQEERLRFLLTRVEAELAKFERLLKQVEAKQAGLGQAIAKEGLDNVEVNVSPHGEEARSLVEELRSHVLDLGKTKNLVASRLNLVVKEEELLEGLQEKYGDSVQLVKLPSGEFEVEFRDADTEQAFNQMQSGKKLLQQLRESMAKK